LPAIHQAIKDLRKVIKENWRLFIEKHNEISLRMMNAQAASASTSQGPISGKTQNWTSHINPISTKVEDCEEEEEPVRR